MKKTMIRLTAILLSVLLLSVSVGSVSAEEILPIKEEGLQAVSDLGVEEGSLELNCQSAILMEATTGAILYTQNADKALPPASVTKIMTLLLIMEAIDSGTVRLENTVSVSANAASMGGSQVYLKEGEQMSVEDLLKSVVIASANDAAVALAEYVAGSVNAFVEKMNAKAKALGMTSTTFENVTGLDDTAENHLTSAKDIAIMSRELIKHPTILQYSSIWMDTIRNGEFGLTNTNRLVRFYRGCTGLKTGSTSKAGFCVSVTAERDGFSLICVIMGAENRDIRNAEATELLDWGFANYGLYTKQGGTLPAIGVKGGVKDTCEVAYPSFSIVLPKNAISSVKENVFLEAEISAPISASDKVGSITFVSNGKTIGEVPIVAVESVEKINFFQIFERIFAKFLLI